MKKISLIVVLVVFASIVAAGAADNLKAFPAADQGMTRYVLQLPRQKDESAFKVELIVGRTEAVDKGNRYFFGGRIEKQTIEGWGFTCYRLNKLGPLAGTRMAMAHPAPKVERFIAVGGEPYLVRYNSRLPIVVYVPDGVEVRYRIWRAGTEMKKMKKG